MRFIMLFDRIEYFSEYSVIKIISDMSERCLLSTRNSFITVFTKKACKNSEISTGAGIPAGRKILNGSGPAVYRYRFHLCYILFIFHRRLRILSHCYSCAFRSHILKSELTSATQSVVGVALLRHSRLPRRHALCSLHPIHLFENIANLVTLVLLSFPLTYPKKRIDERYAVGRRRGSAPPLPPARFYE